VAKAVQAVTRYDPRQERDLPGKILAAKAARAEKVQADVLGHQTEEQLKTRLKNWYITRTSAHISAEGKKVYLLCGDRFERCLETTSDGYKINRPIYLYHQLGFLRIVKTVSSGFQCEVVNPEGEISIVSCRWDMSDRHFISCGGVKYQSTVMDKLTDTYSPNDVVPVLKDQMLIATNQNEPALLEAE
jgi:hypothetical protein